MIVDPYHRYARHLWWFQIEETPLVFYGLNKNNSALRGLKNGDALVLQQRCVFEEICCDELLGVQDLCIIYDSDA